MSGLLSEIYSSGDRMKRKLGGLLSNPLENIALGATRTNEDQESLRNLFSNAYPMAGERTVLNSPQQLNALQALAADKATEMMMAGVTIGKPVNVFHGTKGAFSPEAFDLSSAGKSSMHASSDSPGMWTSRSPKVAEMFVNKTTFDKTPINQYGPRGAGTNSIGLSPWWHDGGNVMPIKATLKNPLVLNGADAERKIFGTGDFRDGGDEFARLVASAKEAGHDGVIIKANPRGALEFRAEQYLLFDPASQAKSKFIRK